MVVETAFVSRFPCLDHGNGKRTNAKGNENGNEGKITVFGDAGRGGSFMAIRRHRQARSYGRFS
jgi:hypothetical protein